MGNRIAIEFGFLFPHGVFFDLFLITFLRCTVATRQMKSAIVGFLILAMMATCSGRLVEEERRAEYEKRNHTWPLDHLVPDTPGWRKLMDRRFAQIEQMSNTQWRYEGFLQTLNAAYLAPNFTENGWGLTRAPEDLMVALRAGIREGVEKARPEEHVEVIEGLQPLFVDRPDLTERVLRELKPLHEAWANTKLTPYHAYGFRLYRNESNLLMHVDKMDTHVISCILHIDSSNDAEPWPILIEDFQGNTNEVVLKSGQMLFYESSKCFHGRPRKFSGSWYSSIFVHYTPTDAWTDTDHKMEAHYAVPPVWNASPTLEPPLDKLQMVGTSMKEPDCPDEWCALPDTVKWPDIEGTYGQVLTTGHKHFPLNIETHEEL